jgi:hypothetical protein
MWQECCACHVAQLVFHVLEGPGVLAPLLCTTPSALANIVPTRSPVNGATRVYRDLGLPEAWRSVVSSLSPFLGSNVALEPAPVHDRFEKVFATIDQRSRHVLRLRAVGETLDEIGTTLDITRERVRQIEKKATKQVLYAGRTLRKDLADWLDEAGFGGHAIVRFTTRDVSLGPIGNVPEVDAWRILCHVVRQERRNMQLHPLGNGRYAILGSGQVKRHLKADAVVRNSWSFVAPDWLESVTGVSQCLLLHATEVIPGLRRTASGLLFSEHWTKLQTAHAVALQLVAAGFASWHFSEIGALLGRVHPVRFATSKTRDFAALLARPGSRFTPANGAGRWTLKPNDAEARLLTTQKRDARRWCERYMQGSDSDATQQPSPSVERYEGGVQVDEEGGDPVSSDVGSEAKSANTIDGHAVAGKILAVLEDAGVPMTTAQIAARMGVHRRIVHRALFDHLVPSGQVSTDDGRHWHVTQHGGPDDSQILDA